MTASKIVVPGATYALTRRCLLRKLLLTPMTPVVHQGLLYALGRALHKMRTLAHHAVLMPNHTHLVVTPTEDNLPDFKRIFYGEAAKFIKVALAEHGFEPPERVFAEGAGHQMRLVNASAQLTYLHYQDVNTINAGLVERVEDYPGLSTDLGLMNGGALVSRRTPLYFDHRTNPGEAIIPFCAPPEVERSYGSAREIVYQLQRARADKERALAASRKRPVLGALAVTQQHPWSEPRSPRRFDRGVTKSFMVVRDEELRIRCCVDNTDFHADYAEARAAVLRGEPAVFPYGTYSMRRHHGHRVADASTTRGRVLNAPGSLERRGGTAPREERRALSRALRREAAIVTDGDLDHALSVRLEAARADEVNRRDAPKARVGSSVPRDSEPGTPDEARQDHPKLVVLRRSTATARRRRLEMQRVRQTRDSARTEVHGELRGHVRRPDPPDD